MTKSEAMAAGREWAEREAGVAQDQGYALHTWQSRAADALALVEGSDAADAWELAEAANEAADRRWSQLVAEVSR